MSLAVERTLELSGKYAEGVAIDRKVSYAEAVDMAAVLDYKVHILCWSRGERRYRLSEWIQQRLDGGGGTSWGPFFVYWNSRERCRAFDEMLRGKGVKTAVVDQSSSQKYRQQVRQGLTTGTVEVVNLCGCWNEGFSHDDVATIVFGDQRHSTLNVFQVLCRGNRPSPGKAFFRVVFPLGGDAARGDLEADDDTDTCTAALGAFVRVLHSADRRIRTALERVTESKRTARFHIESLAETTEPEAEILREIVVKELGQSLQEPLSQEEKVSLFCALCADHPPAASQKIDCATAAQILGRSVGDVFHVYDWWNHRRSHFTYKGKGYGLNEEHKKRIRLECHWVSKLSHVLDSDDKIAIFCEQCQHGPPKQSSFVDAFVASRILNRCIGEGFNIGRWWNNHRDEVISKEIRHADRIYQACPWIANLPRSPLKGTEKHAIFLELYRDAPPKKRARVDTSIASQIIGRQTDESFKVGDWWWNSRGFFTGTNIHNKVNAEDAKRMYEGCSWIAKLVEQHLSTTHYRRQNLNNVKTNSV